MAQSKGSNPYLCSHCRGASPPCDSHRESAPVRAVCFSLVGELLHIVLLTSGVYICRGAVVGRVSKRGDAILAQSKGSNPYLCSHCREASAPYDLHREQRRSVVCFFLVVELMHIVLLTGSVYTCA